MQIFLFAITQILHIHTITTIITTIIIIVIIQFLFLLILRTYSTLLIIYRVTVLLYCTMTINVMFFF